MSCNEDDWAVFWCNLLGPILLDNIEPGERRRFLKHLSQQEVLLPNGVRKRISLSTLRRRVREFRQRRLDGLRRRPRSDRGGVRKRRQAMIERAVALKREQPQRNPKMINTFLEREFGRTIPKATMNRHLRLAGATRRKLGHVDPPVRCRWTRDQANALWVGDFADGPRVLHRGQAIRSHLSIWIDCHSRYVVEGRYYFRENLDILMDSLLRAWGAHGASRELYVDNAKVYHSNALRLATTELNIHLRHRPPRDPPAGGVIERIIQTVQGQFEAEVRAGHVLTLDELNHYFQAWLHAGYHQTVHTATGQTPHERFQQRLRRNVSMSDVLKLFHVRERRTVHRDFSDVQVHNRYFAVDRKLRGDRVVVSFDPYSPLEEVRIYSLHGEFLTVAKRYERERGAHGPAPPQPPQTPLDHSYLKLLEEQHEQQIRREAEQGMDYHRAQQSRLWPFPAFAAAFAKLLGRKGGASGLSTSELEALEQVHRRNPKITLRLLEKAVARADPRTIPVIVHHLQNDLTEGGS